VIYAVDPFRSGSGRPYVVLSSEAHPFADEECLAALVTTTPHPGAISLGGEFETGALPRKSYASPWNLVTLKLDTDVFREVGSLDPALTQRIADEAARHLGANVEE